ncbi:hypothetical protein Tco_0761781 [Tanacetum coccineum]
MVIHRPPFQSSKRQKSTSFHQKQLFVGFNPDRHKKSITTTSNYYHLVILNDPPITPSTKDTSSSSIDYIPKSPTSSTSLLPNGYLNPPTSPPLRVSPPQENASMDITLILSPITPLDVQFDTPSPSPHIFGHLIPWNLLEAHGNSCLCCIHNRTLIFGLRDELQYMFSYSEHMLSQPPTTIIPPPPSSFPN